MSVLAMTMGSGCRAMLRLCGSVGCVGFFALVNFAQLQFAEEGHEPQAEHIEGSETGGDESQYPEYYVSTLWAGGGLPENLVLTEEAAPRRGARARKGRPTLPPQSFHGSNSH